MSAFRIVDKLHCSPPAYVIQEAVTSDGKYIEWPDLYVSVDSAKTALGNAVGKVSVQVCIPYYDDGKGGIVPSSRGV